MKKKYTKYTKELLQEAADKSISISDLCRKLGKYPKGGTWNHLKYCLIKFGINTSHFLGKAACSGPRAKGKAKKHTHDQILVEGKLRREVPKRLRRALIESGRPYKCEDCGNEGEWNNEKLVLQVDHKNGDWSDCRKENLSFVCPNCHSLRTEKMPFRCKG
jgi:predicted RNA-binding Zn-ribbon protein involved in translation (DUF1610 family)